MNEASPGGARTILHATDLSPASHSAFLHALKAAVRNRSELTILHATRDRPEAVRWADFPRVRETLEQWGLLPEGADRSAVLEELGVRVKKVAGHGDNVLGAISRFLEDHPVDLVVLGTEGREGLPRFLRPSTAEPIARKARVATLFVPHGTRGLIDPSDGSVTLKRVLVPVDHTPHPYAAIQFGLRVVHRYGATAAITLLHVGEEADFPRMELPEGDAWTWERRAVKGPVVRTILDAAKELPADLVVMVTNGRSGFLDALRGSTTEQVLREAPCPLLAVPEL